MVQGVMNEYRARKLEDELFERSTFKRPCELIMRHGRSETSYWGRPEVIATTDKEVNGHRMSLTSVIWKTKRDMPTMFTLLLPAGRGLESVMVPCKYMETDKGYGTVINLVISGLVLLNILDYYLLATMTEVGLTAFTSPMFLVPASGIFGAICAALLFNQTHYTYRLNLECYEPDMELGKFHFCYAVGCDLPVHKQLMFENVPAVAAAAVSAHSEVLDEVFIDQRVSMGETNRKIDDMLQNRKHEQVVADDRAQLMRVRPSVIDSPLLIGLVIGVVALVGAVIWLLAGGQ